MMGMNRVLVIKIEDGLVGSTGSRFDEMPMRQLWENSTLTDIPTTMYSIVFLPKHWRIFQQSTVSFS